MRTDFLFLLENRLQPGERLSKTSRKLPLRRAVHYAMQLINAGLILKRYGWMPRSLTLEDFLVTTDHFLFLDPDSVTRESFEEKEFLKRIHHLFLQIFFRGQVIPREKSLGDFIVNYPREFTESLDALIQPEMTLVHFKWRIIDYWKDNKIDARLLSFRFQCDFAEASPFILLPFSNPVMPAIESHCGQWQGVPESEPFPFGAYNRFAERFYFLNLPKHGLSRLPAPEALKSKIEQQLQTLSGLTREELWMAIPENYMDSYSLALFDWLSGHLPLRIMVLSETPFPGRWDPYLASGKATAWNPGAREGKLEVTSGVLPRFETAVFLEQAISETEDSLPYSLQWMMGDGEFRKEFLSRKSQPVDPARFWTETFGEFRPKDEETVKTILFRLQREPGLFLLVQMVSTPDFDQPNEVGALICYAAGKFKSALPFLENLKREPAFSTLYADSLFQTGELDRMASFCRKQGIAPSCYQFLMAQRGEPFDPGKMAPAEEFQVLLMQGKLAQLEHRLSEYRKTRGETPLFLEFKGELHFRRDPEKGEELLRKGIQAAQEKQQLYRKALILKRLGNALYRLPRFRDAEICYYQAMELFVSLDNPWQYEKVAYNMAMVDMNLCRLDAAADFFQKDLKQNRANGHSRYIVFNLKALGKVAAMAYRFEEAAELLENALQMAKTGGFEEEIIGIHYMLVTVYLELEKVKSAKQSLIRLKRLAKSQPFWDIQLQLLEVEYFRKTDAIEKARLALSKLKPERLGHDDILYARVLDALIHTRSLAEAAELYTETGKAESKQFIFVLRSLLLDNYPGLTQVIAEEELKQDYQQVRKFNAVLANRFRHHFLTRKRRVLDPEFFAFLNRLLDHREKNEPTSFRQTFRELGEWAGFDYFELRREKEAPQDDVFSIGNPKSNVFLDIKPDPEKSLIPFLQLIHRLFSGGFSRMSSLPIKSAESDCPYLALIAGHSEAIRKLKREISRAADFMFPVLITGESGTGKELTARAVHFCSRRKNKPFLAINCAALPENLIESELFGYARGAFTGAQTSRIGLLESARDGTVFMDEIGEMPLRVQAKLLRVLQEREFYRLGESTPRKVHARFVFATNRNLEQAVKENRFRADLFYRIAGFRLFTPSLNERREDIPELARYLLNNMDDSSGKQLSEKAAEALATCSFKGNIRELQNMLMMGVVNSGNESEIRPEHLPIAPLAVPLSYSGKLKQATREFQKQYIKHVLEETGYNNSKSARILGISRQRVIQLRKEFDL